MGLNIDEKLSKCGILEKLKINSQKYNNVKDSKNLLAIFEQHIFLWNDAGSCILTAEIKSEDQNEHIQKITSFNGVKDKDNSYKTLTLTNPPVFEVDSISFNKTGTFLAISGRCGVTIYEVPWRYGKFGTGLSEENIISRSWNIAEMFFTCTNRVQVVQVAWHPGSSSKTHITVLCTDNYIRIYDVNDPQVPERAISLNINARSSFLSSEAKISFSSCYGENAISFDFGAAENMQVLKSSSARSSKEYESKIVWPIYLLHGNGDVYVLKAPLKKTKLNANFKLEGPLAMYPPSEDNYGYDACAIMCLHSVPTTIVIATATGMIYHCLMLNDTAKEEENLYQDLSESNGEECDVALYVFESIELPLTLIDDQDDDVYSSPIRLYKDVISHCKYHCTHVSGLHSVAIPFLQALEGNSSPENLKHVLSDQLKQPCIVEHILCTKPFSQMKAVPVLGLDCTVGDGGIILVCLLATWEFVSFSIVSSFLPPAPRLLSEDLASHEEKKSHSSTFEQNLEQALQRSLCSPLVKSFPSCGENSTPQQWLDLLCNVTQRFREDYIQRLTTAHALLRSRVKVLMQQKEYQLKDIKRCEDQKENLKIGVEHLAKKYEDAQTVQQNLQNRVDAILRKLQLNLPYLSQAELEMKQTLTTYEDKIKAFENSLSQIKKKVKYQQEKAKELSDMSDSIVSDNVNQKKVGFNDTQMKHVKELLTQEGEAISDLVQGVNSLKKQLGLG